MIDFQYLENVLASSVGGSWSVDDKRKILTKFGRSANINSGVRTTIAEFQGSVVNETFAVGNTVDSVVCDTSDTGNITLECHSEDASGNKTFFVQTVALNGTAPVSITPCARVGHMYRTNGTYASPATPLTGNVYAYDSTLAAGVTSGVPNTATATKCMISAGNQQSYKSATTISQRDAWMVTHLTVGLQRLSGSGVFGDFELERRELGGVFRPTIGAASISTSANPFAEIDFETPIIILPNSDVRTVVTTASGTGLVGFAEISGFLAIRSE